VSAAVREKRFKRFRNGDYDVKQRTNEVENNELEVLLVSNMKRVCKTAWN